MLLATAKHPRQKAVMYLSSESMSQNQKTKSQMMVSMGIVNNQIVKKYGKKLAFLRIRELT